MPRRGVSGFIILIPLVLGLMGWPAAAQVRTATCQECHPAEAGAFATSVHHNAVRCPDCHGGQPAYELTGAQREALLHRAAGASQPGEFDHGATFRGKPGRADIPVLCGTCHADVERMNPYGLRTDQLAGYWLSGHGKRLKEAGDTKIAVCIDCHGAHDVLSKSNAHSRTYFATIPQTCGKCHGQPALMAEYALPGEILEQYKHSVHGRNLLEKADAGAPNCATCHGSHAAAPPGFSQVGHVCGQCHKQVEEYVLSSVHGRIEVMARCTGCHGQGGNPRNHQIESPTPAPPVLVQTYTRLRDELGDEPGVLHTRFVESLDALPGTLRPEAVCRYCHGGGRADPHAEFFAESDRHVLELGREFTTALRNAQYQYARTADRVARMATGVVLVREEAVQVEDAKTEVLALYAFLHTFNRAEIDQRVQKVLKICGDVNASLDQKQSNLDWRQRTLGITWAFVCVFFVLMYRKYLALRRAYVRSPDHPVAAGVPSPGRRRLLDASLRALGTVAVAALLWPAIAYVLPARKRGGGAERVDVGKVEGWAVWESRKVAVAGKPVAVVRTDQGFKAYSLVCPHLGCIVFWNEPTKEFHCPCHAAVFSVAGKVVSGPAPRGLPEYSVAEVQGQVIVTGASAS